MNTLKITTRIGIVSLLLFSLAACSVEGVERSTMAPPDESKRVTAKTAYAGAELKAKEIASGATLVGFNNHGTSVDRYNYLPQYPDTAGKSTYWMYFFAKDPSMTKIDSEISNEGSFGIVYDNGAYKVAELVELRGPVIFEGNVTGVDMLKTDTDAVFSTTLAELQAAFGGETITPAHVDYNFTDNFGEVTIFTSVSTGYAAFFNYDGTISLPKKVTFGN
ncbi:hypothetical protein KBD59_04795 [Candidatus Gracilibacteria bacterium]|nr:hypothetical protein [Candidatus Gracilibacteria bacterium]